TTDTIYFQITINEAQNPSGKVLNTSAALNGTYGIGSACSFDTTQKQAVTNATITVSKILNTNINKEESMNATASICQSTDNSGGYLCTVQADDNRWDAGKHVVIFDVFNPNRNISDEGAGFFDVRAFYIYGWPVNWYNKNNETITLNVRLYEPGSGWWNSGTGLSGTMTIEKINNYGSYGEWIWPPVQYPYNTSGLNATTVTNGVGTMTVPVNRTNDGTWKSGQYAAVVKATVNGETDYGEMWFSVRKWDAYASPIEISGNNFVYKNSFNGGENISLYVRLTEAGGYYDNGGTYIGNVSMRVKKIDDYSKWPASEVSRNSYNSTIAVVNKTSPWYSNSNAAQNYPEHIINITTSGSWDPGYYSVVIDINGTETGYGWFNVINFQVNTYPANSTGSNSYYFTGTTPIYFNVTTTKNWKYSYAQSDYVNTTIVDGVVRVWQSSSNSMVEYNYPENFNITPLTVNGSAIISVNRSSWPSGWYYGELKMRDANNLTGKGWIYFSVKPFRINTIGSSIVSTRSNLSLNLSIFEPHYYQDTRRFANYTIESVYENRWSYSGYTRTQHTFSPTTLFGQNTSVNITPSSGRWSAGWRYLTILVKDNNTNSTEEQWHSFQALPFQASVSRTSAAAIGPNTNATVNITLTDPMTGARTSGNLSSVYYWGWPSKTEYRFVVDGCDSQINRTCMINGSAIVTLVPPAGGWEEGYRYMYFNFIDDTSGTVETWNSIYFEVRQPITGYMYSVDNNANYIWRYRQNDNVTIYIYSLQNLAGSTVSVNITNVEYTLSGANCWSDSCRTYQAINWSVMAYSNGAFTATGNNITGSGHIRLNKTGNWTKGDYYVRISVSSGSDTATIKNGYFKISDMTVPVVTLTSPSAGSTVGSTITLEVTTSENTVCWGTIADYGSFYSSICGGQTPTNGSAITSLCNNTRYSNSTTYYYEYFGSNYRSINYGSNRNYVYEYGNLLTTGGTAHTASLLTTYMDNQNYGIAFYCYDDDWNSASNYTVFLLNKTVPLTVSIVLPANATYSTTNITLNYTANGTSRDKCYYSLNGASNTTLNGCLSTTFIATEGSNNIRVYVNNTAGSLNSSIVYFSVNSSANASALAVAINSPANATYNTTSLTLNYTVNGTNIDKCFYSLNGGTNTTLNNCTNTTFTASTGSNNIRVYANNTAGTTNSTAVYFSVNTTSNASNITFVSPTPNNETVITNNVTVNVTINTNVTSASLEWNGVNETMQNLSSSAWYSSKSNLSNGNYSFVVYANNSGTIGYSAMRWVFINMAITPTSGMIITGNTTFASGLYNLSSGINISASNITLNCNLAILKGNGTGAGIQLIGYNNVNITNCDVINFDLGVRLQGNNITFQN
ncbi:MAG: hypothetical protein QMD85_01360, partial [Candidatus Aenigmarchaeota archaeon]|nr:hypothetical protein [Candidatus Aenigmarchaeota archaeon]